MAIAGVASKRFWRDVVFSLMVGVITFVVMKTIHNYEFSRIQSIETVRAATATKFMEDKCQGEFYDHLMALREYKFNKLQAMLVSLALGGGTLLVLRLSNKKQTES